MPGGEALKQAGIPIPGLQARDGLAAINGSNLLTAISALQIYDMERFLKQTEIAAAMSIEALLGNLKPYHSTLHELRGFRGAIKSAANIRQIIQGSDLTSGKMKTKVLHGMPWHMHVPKWRLSLMEWVIIPFTSLNKG
jgi:histidine ammonia-lyase